MPCADEVFSIKTGNSNATELTNAPCQSESGHADDCSPFCHCTCCAGFSVIQTLVSFSHGKTYEAISYNSFIASSTVEIAYPIWQPPKA
jgi:hypothetical protein